jgi:hypothetical protein
MLSTLHHRPPRRVLRPALIVGILVAYLVKSRAQTPPARPLVRCGSCSHRQLGLWRIPLLHIWLSLTPKGEELFAGVTAFTCSCCDGDLDGLLDEARRPRSAR